MRTTLDLPDPLFRRLKVDAATHGTTLKQVVLDALNAYYAPSPAKVARKKPEPAWLALTGKISAAEAEQMQKVIAEADFSKVDAEAWK